MFIDYITLMLINLVAGLILLAAYVYFSLGSSNQGRWIPGFGVVGAIALVTGLHMTLTWPVPGSFNIAYGETTTLFDILFIATSITLAIGWLDSVILTDCLLFINKKRTLQLLE